MASMLGAANLSPGPLAKLTSTTKVGYDLSRVGGGLTRGPQEGKTLNAAPWSGTWPAPGATLDLDFANDRGFVRGVGQGRSMDAVTFTRASSANWVDSTGVLRTGAGTFTGTANALGVNLSLTPQDFDNSNWRKDQTSVTAKSFIAPDQTLTAFKLIENTANNFHYMNNTDGIAGLANTAYTASFYVRAAERRFACVQISTDTNSKRYAIVVDLNDGSVTSTSTSNSPLSTSNTVTDVGNGWYRISVTATNTSGSILSFVAVSNSGTPSFSFSLPSYTGDGISGIYIWGAQLETDSSATTYYPTNINVPRFDWASTATVANKNVMAYSNAFSVWPTLGNGIGRSGLTVTDNAIVAPDGTTTASKVLMNSTSIAQGQKCLAPPTVNNSAGTYTFSVYASAGTINYVAIGINDGTYRGATFDLSTGAISNQVGGAVGTAEDVGSGWWRISVVFTSTANFNLAFSGIWPNNTAVNIGANNNITDNTSYISVWNAQIESGSSLTAYQSVAQPTTNTPLAANTTCNGLLVEESRANRLLWCRDATDAAWVKTDVTAAKDQTGIDGVASAASSLTASADNGTCIQTITLASGSRTGSVYLKRITGTGNVQVSLDGSTWSTVDLSDTEWRRIVLSGTVTNPTVGIRLATNGDAVAMDYGQIEDGAFATSPILTTIATVTRSVDVQSIGGSIFTAFYNNKEGTIVIKQYCVTTSNTWATSIGPTVTNASYFSILSNGVPSDAVVSFPSSGVLNPNQLGTIGASFSITGRYSNSVNGSTPAFASNGTYRGVGTTTLWIGSRGANNMTGYISRYIYVPKLVSDTSLQEMTR